MRIIKENILGITVLQDLLLEPVVLVPNIVEPVEFEIIP